MKLFITATVLALVYAASGEKLPHLDGRIVGGTTTTIEEYPYQISLQYYGRHICGGSIISNEIVVTAAHCTDSMSLSGLSVRAGSSFSGKGGVVISVKKIIQHKNFNQKTMDYDISILELSEPLLFNSSIQPINLPATNNRLIEGAESVCTGWGATREGGSGSSQLQTVTVPIVSQEVCQIGYGEAVITEQMICAGITKGGKDACQGDSGGPLVSNSELVGVVSWGYGCARPNYPGIYSNVANLREFIRKESGI